MKKTSVITSIFCTIIFFVHCTIACLQYSGVISGRIISIVLGIVLSVPLSIHMVSSLITMANHSQKDPNASLYPSLNVNVVIQSSTGIMAIVFLVLHIVVNLLHNAYDYKVLLYTHAALELIFVLLLIVHLIVGLPKLFISLGLINNMKSYGVVKKVVFIFLMFPLIMYMISSIQYHFIYA